MNDQRLITMANQIADFFEPYPEEEAVAGIAEHLEKFWEPRMRERIVELPEELRRQLRARAAAAVACLRERVTD